MRRMQPPVGVGFFEELRDGSTSLGKISVVVAENFLVLVSIHERLAGRVAHGLPARDRLISMPLAWRNSVLPVLAYSEPRSERWTDRPRQRWNAPACWTW